MEHRYILTLSCPDVAGIVAAVSGFLAENGGFIIESAQFGDASTGRFFMRVEFTTSAQAAQALAERFEAVAVRFSMQWQMHDKQRKTRTLILVSRQGHCLYDLLYRTSCGALPVEVVAVASNHPDFQGLSEWHRVPFLHFPMDIGKEAQEARIKELMDSLEVDLVVLARYMQILSPELCNQLTGRAINIHHSFLPSFKGARPYHQAYDKGVKLIGATAHYVTTDLDEGPIIEQEVARVDHTHSPEQLAAIGRDTECQALSRAVTYHAEHRVLMNGSKTVVFK